MGILEELKGLKTTDGWTIGEKIARVDGGTGGHFSVGYQAIHEDGRLGFFKALDFTSALTQRDPVTALETLTRSFNFERKVLELCGDAKMSRVVRALSDGHIEVEGLPLGKVFYLIFELADGDVRKQISLTNRLTPSWCLAALHHIAIGLQQLHSKGIAHQDLKPSNVLVFNDGNNSKIADLGRAHCSAHEAPHDGLQIPGAKSYAPPEQIYGFSLQNAAAGRRAGDIYLLGSMLHFLFSGTPITPVVLSNLREEHRPITMGNQSGWTGSFEDALPYILDAWGRAVRDFRECLKSQLTQKESQQTIDTLTQNLEMLTYPDPLKRGHPLEGKKGDYASYSLQRFISGFALLSKREELSERLERAKTA